MKLVRIFKWVGIVLAGVLLILLITAYLMLRASLPVRKGSITLAGVQDSVMITYDRMGIPQVWSRYEADAWFALGWLHASDRLFQMEISRRAASGRLSEMFGEETMEIDRLQRIYGHSKMADAAIRDLDMDTRIRLQAYCNGVNAWVDWINAFPFEYYFLNIDFESWTVKDCLAILSFQTWYTNELQDNGSFYQTIADRLGKAAAEQLSPGYPDWIPNTVPPGQSDQPAAQKETIAGNLMKYGLNGFVMTSASNCWTVSPKRSASGSAMLASDPHLELFRLPQFWYIIGLHAEENALNVLGITSPGLPFLAFGHNSKASWAFTAGGVKVTDVYAEKLNPENSYQYQTPAGWNTFDRRTELVFCNGRDKPDSVLILSSRHGPVIEFRDSMNTAYTLRWAGFDGDLASAAKMGFELAQVNDFQIFRQTITGFGALNANWIYADIMGNIGYQLGTPVPVRNWKYTGLHLPGWTDEFEWNGYHPLDETPHAFNPSQGWLASCNNRPDSANLKYELPGNYAADRILRLHDLLNSQEKFSVADFYRIQQDNRSAFLMLWRQDLADVLRLAGKEDMARQISEWDGDMGIESREAALLELWLYHLKYLIFADELPELKEKLGRREQLRDRVLYNTYHEPYPLWFDDITTDDVFETREQIAQLALEKALDETDGKEWGSFQTLTIAHPFAVIPIIGNLLDLERGPFQRGGSSGTLNATFSVPADDVKFNALAGPSWRFVIDFNDVDAVSMVVPAGQSGHPLDEHFFDFYDKWDQGKMWNVPFSRQKVFARSYSVLNFVPEVLE